MLPDYPSFKRELAEILNIVFRKPVEQSTIAMRDVPEESIAL